MKRLHRIILILALCVLALVALAICADASEYITGVGIVDASSLRLREGPGTDSDVVATASRNDAVLILGQEGDWYKVSYNLKTGYMHKDYLVIKDKENVKVGYARFEQVTNVRKGPGTDTGVVDQAPKNETCFIIGYNNGWFKVSYNGQRGYVRSDLVTMLEMPYYNSGSTGNTYKEDANANSNTNNGGSSNSNNGSGSSNNGSGSGSSNSGSGSSNNNNNNNNTNSDLGQRIATFAQQYVGYKYTYAGSSPSTGFDCSGLTYYVAKQFGYKIGRTANQQLSAGTFVARSDLKPGDIVLFERTYTSSEKATHAGIYIGNGKFVHAANSRTGVVISSLSEVYYSSRFICGRRLG